MPGSHGRRVSHPKRLTRARASPPTRQTRGPRQRATAHSPQSGHDCRDRPHVSRPPYPQMPYSFGYWLYRNREMCAGAVYPSSRSVRVSHPKRRTQACPAQSRGQQTPIAGKAGARVASSTFSEALQHRIVDWSLAARRAKSGRAAQAASASPDHAAADLSEMPAFGAPALHRAAAAARIGRAAGLLRAPALQMAALAAAQLATTGLATAGPQVTTERTPVRLRAPDRRWSGRPRTLARQPRQA